LPSVPDPTGETSSNQRLTDRRETPGINKYGTREPAVMVKFTLLEIHIDDPDFEATANARYASGEKEVEPGGDPPEPETDSRAGAAVAALVGLTFLVVVAYLTRSRVLEDDDDEFGVDG